MSKSKRIGKRRSIKTQRAIVAYHEAGHAVVGHMLGVKVRRVSIEDDNGVTRYKRLGRGERAILIILAGPYAQKRFAPHSRWRSRNYTGFDGPADFDKVTGLIYDAHGTERTLVLVRPDGHVAWRGDALPPHPERMLDQVTGWT
jgi:hypothetical protein